jgi:hypothetical protein
MHLRSLLLPAALAMGAVLASGCGGITTSAGADRLEIVARDNHLVAVAYRAEGRSQETCARKARRGAITSDEQAAGCLSAGLDASGLEASIGTLRGHVLDIGRRGDDDCRAAAGRLADLIAQEQRYIHASRDDLARLDARAYSDDGMRAGDAAAREADPTDALLRACADG